jgi:LacI family repressor for deo operon, udp, cdd, tsx, nupC, and nupG
MVKRISNGSGSGHAATMRDVASLVGVSQATVSYVLNAKRNARVGMETRQRVLEAAAALQYRPNAIARAMASGCSRTIGVYQPHVAESALSGMWSTLVTRGIGEALNQREQHLLLFGYRGSDEPPPSSFVDGRVDGLIILAPHREDELPKRLANLNFPTVIVGSYAPEGTNIASVDADNVRGAWNAVEHLINLGHKRIAHLVGPINVPNAVDRWIGYEQAMVAHGLLGTGELTIPSSFQEEGGYRSALEVLARSPSPTALFIANDIAALGALRACADMSLRVPEDVAIVGYDDSPVCVVARPQLTTMRQPAVEMGRAAVELMMSLKEGEPVSERNLLFPAELIIRESCGANS